ncbi:phage integrase family protein [Xenorhabdus doucetiae]|uniref:Phage integrase family protein n=1 Tax=Xenorhabdus doucetiae TaxID=351671 RepID=A0ABY3NMF6_9GAMM|nr:phage integrase family protein [Xenorhabdus doucetiae]
MERKLLPHTQNPFNDAAVKKEKKKKKILSKSQITRIYLLMQQYEEAERTQAPPRGRRSALYPWYWLTVLDTLRFTGMRLNQLLHLRLRDVNLENNSIELRVEGSKNHSEWRIPMIRQLKPRLAQLVEQAKACGAEDDDPLFDLSRLRLRYHGQVTSYSYDRENQYIRSFFYRLSKKCGFAVSPHRFRHTLATELMKSPDRNLHLVKCLLGHRSLATTMEYIDIDMDIAGKTLESELVFYMDFSV